MLFAKDLINIMIRIADNAQSQKRQNHKYLNKVIGNVQSVRRKTIKNGVHLNASIANTIANNRKKISLQECYFKIIKPKD